MDSIDSVWNKFFQHRNRPIWERFPGQYRAIVTETNDPLNLNRIRFKCPDMHDFNLKADECPWAVPASDIGGKRAKRFHHPCIGDWVWISFEKQHPYGPIWNGFADPTRKRLYAYPQVYQITPLSVNDDGSPAGRPKDYDSAYLPKDGRPMSHGWQDRYGNLDMHSSVGFFPIEHDQVPPPPDHDPLQGSNFSQQSNKPLVNNPDKKYMLRMTKYGMMHLQSDQGYYWKNEFSGDHIKDEKFETKRWLYLQRLINNNKPSNYDNRQELLMTRYGSRIELRDVGWAQAGPIASKSRVGEYGNPVALSNESERDERWVKIRSKGGMLYQQIDIGFNPLDDTFIKRPIMEEMGNRSEQEDIYWKNKDARMIRSVTRYGLKIVQDDRGSDTKAAHKREVPRGNGILIKGRRSPASKVRKAVGNPKGFYWEFNENDEANHTTWGSPLGQTIEINDRYQYIMLTASLGKGFSAKFKGLKENEFIRKPTMIKNPEFTSHHLKIDHDNEYIRLKTRAGNGTKPDQPIVESSANNLNQGFEARDGNNGDGPWVEMVDAQHRGFWLSKKFQLGIWRARNGRHMYQWLNEKTNEITIYNNESNGDINIFTHRNVNILSAQDVQIQADRHIFLKAGRSIRMQAGATRLTIAQNIQTNAIINAARVNAFICGVMGGPGAGCPNPSGVQVERIEFPELPEEIEPHDRGKTYNGPFEECPIEEVEHPLIS